jgi:hypothetical protein
LGQPAEQPATMPSRGHQINGLPILAVGPTSTNISVKT